VARAAREKNSQIDGTMFLAKAEKHRLLARALFRDCSMIHAPSFVAVGKKTSRATCFHQARKVSVAIGAAKCPKT
jgi:hypothetical protein